MSQGTGPPRARVSLIINGGAQKRRRRALQATRGERDRREVCRADNL